MSAVGLLKYGHLAYFSKPAHLRPLWRAIRRGRAVSLVELGIGMGLRTRRMIEVALRYRGDAEVRYTGIDLFEARPQDDPGMTIKRAHRMLHKLGVKSQVVPGDPYSALARTANSLQNTDLIVIGADQDAESLARAWFYVPRMLHGDSQVFVEEEDSGGQLSLRKLDAAAIDNLARQAEPPARRAA